MNFEEHMNHVPAKLIGATLWNPLQIKDNVEHETVSTIYSNVYITSYSVWRPSVWLGPEN